jgi:hypothetical protein
LTRVVPAFAAAPPGGAILPFLAMLTLDIIGGGPSPHAVAYAGAVALVFAGFGYAAAIVLGIPGFLLFRRLGWVGRAQWIVLCAGVGSVAGALASAALFAGEMLPGDILSTIGVFAVAGLFVGAASGLAFSLVIRFEPPDAKRIAAAFD